MSSATTIPPRVAVHRYRGRRDAERPRGPPASLLKALQPDPRAVEEALTEILRRLPPPPTQPAATRTRPLNRGAADLSSLTRIVCDPQLPLGAKPPGGSRSGPSAGNWRVDADPEVLDVVLGTAHQRVDLVAVQPRFFWFGVAASLVASSVGEAVILTPFAVGFSTPRAVGVAGTEGLARPAFRRRERTHRRYVVPWG